MDTNTGIESLSLSNRARNALKRAGINTVGDLLSFNRSTLLELPAVGTNTAREIIDIINILEMDGKDADTGAPSFLLQQDTDQSQYEFRFDPEYHDSILSYVKARDKSLDVLGFSTRSTNQLRRNGRNMLSDIIFLTMDELLSMPAMGAGSANEVVGFLDDFVHNNESRIRALHEGDTNVLWDKESIKNNILKIYTQEGFRGMSFKEIKERVSLPDGFPENHLKKVIGELLAAGELEYVDFRLYRKYPSFQECLDTFPLKSERNRVFTRRKLDGETLENIGSDFDITRERVRQIVNNTYKEIKKVHKATTGLDLFDEDYYKYFYETYSFDRKEGSEWFGISMATWKYLDLVDVKRGQKSLEDAETDQKLDPGLRLKIKNYNNKDKLFIDGMWIRKRRPDLEEAIVRKYCTEDTSFTEFADIYNSFLKKYGISDDDLILKEDLMRSRKGNMSAARYLLWKQNERLRHYDIDGRDYSDLIDELGLESFENIEISTLKLVEDHPAVLQRYDIRDQYELHNLLRKIIPDGAFNGFHCGRMPMITFGSFDRNKAIEDIVLENAPLTNIELADLVHEEFGYDQATVIGTYLNCVSKYYHKGIYEVDFKKMTPERQKILYTALSEDGYLISEIKRKYKNIFPDADADEVNPFTLKEMGFAVFSKCVVRNHKSLESFFESILTEKEITDITEYKRRFAYDVSFTNKLSDLKRDLCIIEFEPNQVIRIDKLEKSGVTKEDIKSFCNEVYDFVEEGRYFSARSLVANGFQSRLYDLGFSDWFYANLLFSDERFSHTRVYNNLILYKGNKDISVKSFQADLIKQHGSVDIYDFINELTDVYGCTSFERYDVVEKTKNTGVYYDKILDRLYASIDVYEDELERMDDIW